MSCYISRNWIDAIACCETILHDQFFYKYSKYILFNI